MSIERKANRVLEQAQALAREAGSWADFSVTLFDRFHGIVPKTFTSEIERQAFLDSPQYKEIQQLLLGLMQKFGVEGGATPKVAPKPPPEKKSGRFVVRVPTTVHHKLDIEAKKERVSLNQLAVAKLALPLPRATGLAGGVVIQAFNDTHEGHSQDWVIIDPRLNPLFLKRCRKLGLDESEYTDTVLNHVLMNIRKTSKFKGLLNPTTKASGFANYDDCAFAAEIGVRTLQRTDGVTLDRILCDPVLRERYDDIAKRLAPATQIKLRSAALNLRKTHRLKPMEMSSDKYELVSAGPVKRVSLSAIAELPGTYVFYDHTRPLFAGETDNLQRRIETHLKNGLPKWLGAEDDEGITLRLAELPSASRDNRLKWLVTFINHERPLLNYQNAA